MKLCGSTKSCSILIDCVRHIGIDPPVGKAYCANDFDPATDKCPEGEVCAINDQWTVEVEDDLGIS